MDLSRFYPPRPPGGRKGDYGRVVVVGGSDRYAGAPAFNALAALRAGADLALVVAPRRAADIVASYSPDLITVPTDGPFPDPEVAVPVLAQADAVVLGGGVARTPEAHEALRHLLAACGNRPTVLDAEGLRAIAGRPDLTRGRPLLLTPHGGEFEAFTRRPWPASLEERDAAVRDAAREFGVTVIVKGETDHISDGVDIHRDLAGSSYLTKGGYGDLLAGAAAAFLARKASPLEAARGAAHLVGSAGVLAAAELGESTLASDALARFPRVIPR